MAGACLALAGRLPAPAFDANRALEHIEALVAIGPRPPGSPGAARAREYITRALSAAGVHVDPQPFEARTPIGPIPMVNLRAAIGDQSRGPRVIVAGHYDTKLFRDAEFVGANDGGSSAGFLIELARVLAGRTDLGPLEIVFFDGEEAVVTWQDGDRTYGSRHYVDAARQDGTLDRIGALVLVDMIADREPRFGQDANSTGWLTEILWSRARSLGRHEFVDEITAIEDDHLPFIEAGVPAVDIIDMDYPAWHTPEDTMDKVSPAGLQAVGDVLLAALPDIFRALRQPRPE